MWRALLFLAALWPLGKRLLAFAQEAAMGWMKDRAAQQNLEKLAMNEKWLDLQPADYVDPALLTSRLAAANAARAPSRLWRHWPSST